LIDNELIGVVGFLKSENMGSLMENLVAIELLRRKNY
jgi:predicted AAA+ superfamily ATPase